MIRLQCQTGMANLLFDAIAGGWPSQVSQEHDTAHAMCAALHIKERRAPIQISFYPSFRHAKLRACRTIREKRREVRATSRGQLVPTNGPGRAQRL